MKLEKGNIVGLKRNVDKLGRIVIPVEIRKELSITCHDSLEIIPYEKGIFIRKACNT